MLKKLIKKIRSSKKRAQSLVEYGLILALVSVVAITVLQTMGTKIKDTVGAVNSNLENAQKSAQGQ